MMALATSRPVIPAENITSDVGIRVDEWLRGVSAGEPRAGSESVRPNSGSGLSDLSSITGHQPIQWPSETSPSDKVKSWLSHGSLANPQGLTQGLRSDSSTARHRDSVAILLTHNRFQSEGGHPPATGRFDFLTSVPILPTRHRRSSARSPIDVQGLRSTILEKGKGPALVPPMTAADTKALETIELEQAAAICGICQEEFYPTSTPLKTAHSPSSSSQSTRYGLYLQCPLNHGYCLDCLASYIRVKLEDKEGHAKFPVRCPECPPRTNWEIDDETAGRVLVKDLLDAWHSQRLLASINMFYCPNPKCSEAIEIPEDIFDPDHTECPACRSEICYQCRSIWHVGLTCEDAKNPLPDEEALQRLAARNHWRRCPRCGVMVERTEGCNHMTCRCGAEFCFACGADYAGGCTRIGGCDGEWREGGARGIQPLETVHIQQRPRPLQPWDYFPHPQPLFLRPPTPPRPIPTRFPESPIVPAHHEAQQQEATVVSRPRRLQRRRPDDEPALIQVRRPRKLSRPRPPVPIPVGSHLSVPRGSSYAIPRLWRPRARPSDSSGDSGHQTPHRRASVSARRSSGTPTEEEWVVVNSGADSVRQTIIMQPPSLDEGVRAPITRLQLAAADARMKPLPPVPAVTPSMQETNMADVGNGSRLAFPIRPRRDSEQSRNTRRGLQPLRLPRLSLPSRSRP